MACDDHLTACIDVFLGPKFVECLKGTKLLASSAVEVEPSWVEDWRLL